ncbi:MAG TPA: hypothetical protein VFP63_04980, partial [Dehalococcoidia bacterium]|nr:hypothetical protein [Dehalococcoidia bacterium]
MPYNPLAWWGAFRIVRWVLWRAPRGLYHLAVPRAYDTWKVRHEWRAAWKEHRRHCRPCWPEHRAGVLATVEDSL